MKRDETRWDDMKWDVTTRHEMKCDDASKPTKLPSSHRFGKSVEVSLESLTSEHRVLCFKNDRFKIKEEHNNFNRHEWDSKIPQYHKKKKKNIDYLFCQRAFLSRFFLTGIFSINDRYLIGLYIFEQILYLVMSYSIHGCSWDHS